MAEQQDMISEEPAVHCKHDAMVATVDVKPNPENPNVHPQGQLELMAGVLRANGWREALVVSRRSGFVVKGHGRLATALFMKLSKVPVEYQDYVDEQAELRDLIADNRVAQHAYVDALGLGKLLRRISSEGQKDLGYSQEEIGLFMAVEYVAPKATDRQFKVLETLKMTKDCKAIIARAVQKLCLKLGKEIDWGEALATICIAWEAAMSSGAPLPTAPPPPPQQPPAVSAPVQAPAEPEKKKKQKVGRVAMDMTAAPATPADMLMTVDYVAQTTLNEKALHVIRFESSPARVYTDDHGITELAQYLKGQEVRISVAPDAAGNLWAKSIIKA